MCTRHNALLLLLLSTLTPAILGASGETYCEVVVDAFSLCEYSTPGFDNLEPTQQASCLCGPSMATVPWGPSSFDSYMNGCYSYEATASPAAASSLSNLQNFCASNYVAHAQTTAAYVQPTPTVTSPRVYQTATQAQSNKYCEVVVDAFSLCEYSTPGFDNLEPTQQASCLCGPSMATVPWGPSSFDSYMNGCYSYEATASPAAASSLSGLQNFCASNYAARITASTTAVATITPGPTRSSKSLSTLVVPISTTTTSSRISIQSNTADHSSASTFSFIAVILASFFGIR